MTSVPTTAISELLAQRAAASASAETVRSASGEGKPKPDPDSPFEVVSPQGGSVVESTGGGGDWIKVRILLRLYLLMILVPMLKGKQ
jgi:hypothetical protein